MAECFPRSPEPSSTAMLRREAVAVIIGRPAIELGWMGASIEDGRVVLGETDLPAVPHDSQVQSATLTAYLDRQKIELAGKLAADPDNISRPLTMAGPIVRAAIEEETGQRHQVMTEALQALDLPARRYDRLSRRTNSPRLEATWFHNVMALRYSTPPDRAAIASTTTINQVIGKTLIPGEERRVRHLIATDQQGGLKRLWHFATAGDRRSKL